MQCLGDLSRVEMWKLKLKEFQHLCCKVTWPNKDSKLTARVTTFETCKITVWCSAEMHIKIAEKELNIFFARCSPFEFERRI